MENASATGRPWPTPIPPHCEPWPAMGEGRPVPGRRSRSGDGRAGEADSGEADYGSATFIGVHLWEEGLEFICGRSMWGRPRTQRLYTTEDSETAEGSRRGESGRHRGLPLQCIGPPSINSVAAGPRARPPAHARSARLKPRRPTMWIHRCSSVAGPLWRSSPVCAQRHRLESLCHQNRRTGVQRLRLWRESVPGLEMACGAWALARFCAPWVPDAGEKGKNALSRSQKAFGMWSFGTRGRGWEPVKAFFSFSPGNCLRCKKRAKAHSPGALPSPGFLIDVPLDWPSSGASPRSLRALR